MQKKTANFKCSLVVFTIILDIKRALKRPLKYAKTPICLWMLGVGHKLEIRISEILHLDIDA